METEIDKESKLIDVVRDYRVIWDKKVDGYRRKKENVWIEISTKLNLNINARECQKLWDKLRSQFMAHRRKLRKPTGSAAEKRPYYRHENSMRFICDAVDEEKTYTNLNPEDAEFELEENLNNEVQENGAERNLDMEENEDGIENISGSRAPEVLTSCKDSNADHRVHEKYRGKRKIDPFDEALLSLIKTDEKEKDEYFVFGNFVAVKLRKIAEKDLKVAAIAQHSIGQVIHDSEISLL